MKISTKKFGGDASAQKNGYTLVELLIVIAISTILVIAVSGATNSLYTTYRNVDSLRQIESASISILDRLTREIKNATSVDMTNSVFDDDTGRISLNISSSTGSITNTRIYASSSRLYVSRNGVQLGPLSPDDVKVSLISYSLISTSTNPATAIRIELVLDSPDSSQASWSKSFYGTAIMRGTY
jgi:prepilin-type N-terminal cleavage/methylation domain-containing protein